MASSRTQLRDDAAAHIRELIISGQVAPGTLIRLAPLAERIRASITPVREALLLLTQDGWLVQEPNRGFRVASLLREDVRDAYLVYAFAAGELARRAAPLVGELEIAQMRKLDEEMQALGAGDDEHHVEELNYKLHDIIWHASDSPRLLWLVNAASRFVPRRFWPTIPGWVEFNLAGHRPIINALELGDPDASGQLMSEHISRAGELLMSHLDATGFWTRQAD
ncbi:MAG TPA: GntR family transcriptional regulator [Thermoleophilaceae bacterium]|nr:GntR family transcriptional regulator [Thermoleophilaceae bacterium]